VNIEPNSSAPAVSVIMPAFNAAHTLRDAVLSVQEQTFGNWELVVVDDCSPDGTFELATELKAQVGRMKVIRHATNMGVAAARNTAMEAAEGRYLAFLDSDDMWLPRKLEAQLAFMQQGGFGVTYTSYRRFSASGLSKAVRIPSRQDYVSLLKSPSIACLTAICDRSHCGTFHFPKVRHEDYAVWLALAKRGLIMAGLQEDLARYRVSINSVSGNKLRSASWVWRIYRQHERLSFGPASWYFANYAINSVIKHADW
jgi:teichuronic acid biosynthesis glycosyltransferase TuaG